MSLTFERKGRTWTASHDHWEVMLIGRDVYYGTERLVVTMTVARNVPYEPRQMILTERLDLMGSIKRKNFAGEAAERLQDVGGKNIKANQAAILTMVELFMEHLQLVDGSIERYDLGDIEVPDDLTPPYVLWPMVPSSRPGMLVSPSGSGKSTLAGAIGLSVVTGRILLSRLEPREQGPVLYIGQEESKEQWAARITQLCKGHGITPPKTGYHYMKLANNSLVASAERVAESAALIKAKLVIIDSAQATWGAESDNIRGWATQWFNAVEQLEIPTLVIDHPNRAETGKPSDDGFAAGSSVKRDRVGHSWALKSVELMQQLGGPRRYLVTIRDTKRNYVARQLDIIYETIIKGYEWIRLGEPSISDPTDLEKPTKDEGSHTLRRMMLIAKPGEQPEGMTAVEAATALGVKDTKAIRAELTDSGWRHLPDFSQTNDFRFVKVEGTGFHGNPARYTLETRPHVVQLSVLEGGAGESGTWQE